MFFSSAITAILPYLLFLGVISTFFYGISEKLNLFSQENPDHIQVAPDNTQNSSFLHERTISFNESHSLRKENPKTLDQNHFLENNIQTCPHFDFLLSGRKNTKGKVCLLHRSINTDFTFRGPPTLG